MKIAVAHPTNRLEARRESFDDRSDPLDGRRSDLDGDEGADHGGLQLQKCLAQPVERGLRGALNDALTVG